LVSTSIGSIGQEFYRYPLSTVAGKAAIQTRLRLLDYIYTFIHKAHVDGTPAMWPLSWVHPEDNSTYSLEHQFYFGPALLVSPVIAENSTTVSIYLPNATYYDFFDLTPVQGNASQVTLQEVGYETIPLHILEGNVLPLRTGAVNTTAQNHELPFHVVVAPNATGQAYGELRLDDGISLDTGSNFSDITMTFSNNSRLEIAGTFGFQGVGQLDLVVFAGQTSNKTIKLDGQAATEQAFDPEHQTLTAWNLALAFGEHVVTLE
jgi:alpha-glucosidase